MRPILAGLVLLLLPSFASAECLCTCIGGKATAICRPQAMVEPICQQICVEKIEQSLGALGGGGAGGAGRSSLGGSVGVDAGLGIGLGIGNAQSLSGFDAPVGSDDGASPMGSNAPLNR